ncbi:MAG: division plane positioning ATPase MipZ [Pseudomonadota bacterium]
MTIAQQKGGAGKSTLAIHLAVAWSATGRRGRDRRYRSPGQRQPVGRAARPGA